MATPLSSHSMNCSLLSQMRSTCGSRRNVLVSCQATCQSVLAQRHSWLVARQQLVPTTHTRAPSIHSSTICRDSKTPESSSSSSAGDAAAGGNVSGLAVNAGLLSLWAALMGYVFFLAPNQTPTIDAFVVQKLVGLKTDDPFQVNQVFTAVWNFMGLYPLLYAAILIPGARTNKLPAWPFVCASVFLGAYALIPFMCLWSPKGPPEQLPPPEAELEGWNKFYMRSAETPWLPLGLIAGSSYWLFQAVTAGGEAWLGYLQFFDESRLAHATSIDFMLCTLLMPFWMSNDAQGRRWENRGLVPLLCLLPLVGPATYLLLRPKTYAGISSSGDGSSS